MKLTLLSLVVADYDEAIAWFTQKLGFDLIEDTTLSPEKRWVVVAPKDGAHLLLAKASGDNQKAHIGDQTGGRVFLFLETEDFDSDYAAMKAKGVSFMEEPRDEEYGRVVVFEDLYGNKWDLIGPR